MAGARPNPGRIQFKRDELAAALRRADELRNPPPRARQPYRARVPCSRPVTPYDAGRDQPLRIQTPAELPMERARKRIAERQAHAEAAERQRIEDLARQNAALEAQKQAAEHQRIEDLARQNAAREARTGQAPARPHRPAPAAKRRPAPARPHRPAPAAQRRRAPAPRRTAAPAPIPRTESTFGTIAALQAQLERDEASTAPRGNVRSGIFDQRPKPKSGPGRTQARDPAAAAATPPGQAPPAPATTSQAPAAPRGQAPAVKKTRAGAPADVREPVRLPPERRPRARPRPPERPSRPTWRTQDRDDGTPERP